MPAPSGSTAKYGLSYPLETDIPDVPAWGILLAQGVENIIATAYQGTAAARPAAGDSGRFYYATDTNTLSYDSGGAWTTIFPQTFRTGRTYAVSGLVAVPSGATNYLPPFCEPVQSGGTKTLQSVRYVVRGGTSVSFEVTQNGSVVSGLGSLSATTTVATTAAGTPPSVSDGDEFAVVVSGLSGTPDGLSVTFNFATTI